MFLSKVLSDEQKTLARLALAGIIFSDYELGQNGYVDVDIPHYARKAKLGRSIMYEALDWLRSQQYLVRQPGTNLKNRYVLGPGPVSGTADSNPSSTADKSIRLNRATNR
ncbi:MAG: hypothetical protein WCD69_25170 [Xanthobacteraceae bacterium]